MMDFLLGMVPKEASKGLNFLACGVLNYLEVGLLEGYSRGSISRGGHFTNFPEKMAQFPFINTPHFSNFARRAKFNSLAFF